MVINVGRSPSSRALIDAMVTTLQTVFPSVHVMDIPYTLNTMVYATAQPTEMDDLIGNYLPSGLTLPPIRCCCMPSSRPFSTSSLSRSQPWFSLMTKPRWSGWSTGWCWNLC